MRREMEQRKYEPLQVRQTRIAAGMQQRHNGCALAARNQVRVRRHARQQEPGGAAGRHAAVVTTGEGRTRRSVGSAAAEPYATSNARLNSEGNKAARSGGVQPRCCQRSGNVQARPRTGVTLNPGVRPAGTRRRRHSSQVVLRGAVAGMAAAGGNTTHTTARQPQRCSARRARRTARGVAQVITARRRRRVKHAPKN